MKRNVAGIASIVLLLLLRSALGQVTTGTPPFGSFGGGPFDIVNLGNLNTHFDIPVIQKAGRGAPYTYTLSYDNTVWTPVTSSGTRTWTAAPNYGWNFQVPQYAFGYVSSKTITSYQQPCNPPGNMTPVNVAIYGYFSYIDGKNTAHAFPTDFYVSYQSISGCNLSVPPTSGSSVAIDNSGYTINAWGVSTGAGASITGSNGKLVNLYQTSSSTTDANGNEVTSVTGSGATMVVTDTLGQTVLTVSGTNPVLLAYAAPNTPTSGVSAEYKINYTAFNIKTNFNCSGVVDPTINGAMLISSIDLPDGTSYQFTYESNGSYKTGRLASVTLPTLGSISYAYPGANDGVNCNDGSTLGMTRTLSSPGGEWTYARAPGSGSAWTTTVTSPPDPVNTPNSANDVTVINFVQDNGGTQNFYETQRMAYQGSASGTPLLTATTCYNANYSNCGSLTSFTAPPSQTDAYTQLGSGGIRLSEVKYNAYGLPTDDMEYDYGVALNVTPAPSKRVRETATTYASLTNGIVNAPATVIVSDWSSTSAVTVSSTSYTYDQGTPATTSGTPQHVSITGSRGNLTTLATQANSTTTLYQVFSYYDTGNLKTVTDRGTTTSGGANVTTYTYSNATATCGNAFASGVSEPLSLTQSYTWNCIGGVMVTATDENSSVATWDYTSDAYFWRPDYTEDWLSYKTTYAYTGQTTVESTLLFNNENSVSDLRTTVDGFGRPILNQRGQTPSPTEYDSTESCYNIMGQASFASMPYQSSSVSTTCPPATAPPGITTTYDALGRLYTVTDGGSGTVSYSYIKNDVLQTVGPTQNFIKQFEYDGLGRLTSVCEVTTGTTAWPGGACNQSNAKTGYFTTYAYDALGNLLKVTQNAQSSTTQTRTYTYDLLSRLTSETNPETGNSSSGSDITYSYDTACGVYAASAGDLIRRQDKAGNVTCYGYDGLHRLTDEGYQGLACRHFRYDTQTPPSGVTVTHTLARLAEAYTTACSGAKITDEWFGYDRDDRLTDFYQSTPNSGGYYHSSAGYWANGTIDSVSALTSSQSAIFPTIYYGTSTGAWLDGEGRPTKVYAASGTNPVTGVTYVTSGTTEPIGALTSLTLGSGSGSGDTDSFTFDPNTGRPASYTFAVNGVNDTGTLTWNKNGTLGTLGIVDSLSGSTDSETCNYYYDDLARLGGKDPTGSYSVDCGTKWSQLFKFDPFGNITKSGSGGFSVLYTETTNQFSSIPGVTAPYYDSNGNLTKDNLNTYTWDPNWGNPASINGTTLIYDALGQMVEQQVGSTYTQILYSPAGKTAIMNGQTLIKAFVYLPGGETAIYNSSGLAYYRHPDWLGSSRLTSTASRTVYSDSAYAPYGEQYALYDTADPSFTGQNADTTSTLYDFPFRENSPTQGRWISPDPAGMAVVDPMNPQTWNRYAYVMNSPLAFTDPLGLQNDCNSGGSGVMICAGSGNPCQQNYTLFGAYGCVPSCPGQGLTEYMGWVFCGPPINIVPCIGNCGQQNGGQQNGGAANNGTPQQPQQTPQQPKKQPWYCGTGNSWSSPFTAPTGQQWGHWAAWDGATALTIASFTKGLDPVSRVLGVSAAWEAVGWADCK